MLTPDSPYSKTVFLAIGARVYAGRNEPRAACRGLARFWWLTTQRAIYRWHPAKGWDWKEALAGQFIPYQALGQSIAEDGGIFGQRFDPIARFCLADTEIEFWVDHLQIWVDAS